MARGFNRGRARHKAFTTRFLEVGPPLIHARLTVHVDRKNFVEAADGTQADVIQIPAQGAQ